MRKYREITETRSVETQKLCDVCGGNVRGKGGWDGTDVTVECERGEVFTECDTRDFIRYDICPDCFEDRLGPFLESLGATKYTRSGEDDEWEAE